MPPSFWPELLTWTPLKGVLVSVTSLALLAATILLLRQSAVARIERAMRLWAAFLLRRGLFRAPLQAEENKINFLRIVAGLILLHRNYNVAIVALYETGSIDITLSSLVSLGLTIAFTVGLATPLVCLTLLITNIYILDNILGVPSLGTDVLAMLLLTFTFAPAGTTLSADAWWTRRRLPGTRFILALYSLFGKPTLLRVTITKWLTLFSYSLLCLYSVVVHLNDPGWTNGDAAVILLTSTYLAAYPAFFRSLFADSWIAVEMVKLSMVGMIAWYIYLLPAVLIGGWLRRLAVVWMFMFFIFSAVFLQVAWLPYYEFVLFFLLFWNKRFLRPARQLHILYDDGCNLCDRTVRSLRLLDIFHALAFKPLSGNIPLVAKLGLTEDDVLRDLHARDPRDGAIYVGYGMYVEVAKRLLLLAWAWPVAQLGRLTGIGPAIYRLIADRRKRLFGICILARSEERYPPSRSPMLTQAPHPLSRTILAGIVLLYACLALVFIVGLPHSPIPVPKQMLRVAHVFGLAPIDVFNQQDLRMSEHWFTLTVSLADGSTQLVPINGEDGSRLAWHVSDRVYFGNSLKWRRSRLVQGAVCFASPDELILGQQIGWFMHRHPGEIRGYRATYYYQPMPTVTDASPYFHQPLAEKVCSAYFDSSGALQKLEHYGQPDKAAP